MRVDLFRILGLETKHHLHGDEVGRIVTLWSHELLFGRYRELRGVFKDMRGSFSAVFVCDFLFHDGILVDANGCEDIECTKIARLNTVKDEGDDNLLPGLPSIPKG